ncbi:hypothetical protein ACSQ67_000055 [Phaseolus vulgaris]
MALSKLILASLIASLLVLHLVDAHQSIVTEHVVRGAVYHLIQISRKRACGTCCQRCNRVPPGTSGNQEMCPCYARLTTHDGKPKCP